MTDRFDEAPHDVLAADEFGMPAGDPTLRRGPLKLPEETYPSNRPHDVLSAEEFAMPAGPAAAVGGEGGRGPGRLLAVAAAALVAAAITRARRRSAD